MEHVQQMLEPIYNENSKILILGTFPSVKSRETEFYYGNPQNRFWKVIANITGCNKYDTVDEKKKMLIDNNIALWDTIESCDIEGSSDSSITNVVPADLSIILNNSCVNRIYVNGDKAFKLYNKYLLKTTGIEAVKLPSTIPANARFTLDKLIHAWQVIKE